MKRVGFVLKGYPRVSEAFIAQEIYLLEQMGFEIEIFSMRQPREKQRQPINAKIKARVTYIPEYIFSSDFGVFLKAFFASLSRTPLKTLYFVSQAILTSLKGWDSEPLKRFFQALSLIRQANLFAVSKLDFHLHSHFIHAPTLLTMWVSKMTGLSFSISAHAKDIYTIPPEQVVERVNASQFLTTCTQFNYEFLRGLPGIDRDKVFRNYHGVDLQTFNRRPNLPASNDKAASQSLRRLVSVGRLVPKKGYPLLLKALSQLNEEGFDFTYDIFGEGELYPTLMALTDQLGLKDRVVFHRVATHPQIIEFFNDGCMFLSGSLQTEDLDRDGIPNTIAEAMAMQIPVIASNVSGIPELIEDRVSGFLYPEKNLQALIQTIKNCWQDTDGTLRVGRAGRDRVAQIFNAQTLIHDCADLLGKHVH